MAPAWDVDEVVDVGSLMAVFVAFKLVGVAASVVEVEVTIVPKVEAFKLGLSVGIFNREVVGVKVCGMGSLGMYVGFLLVGFNEVVALVNEGADGEGFDDGCTLEVGWWIDLLG